MIVFGDGTQTRDFTYVGDTATGIALAGVADAAIGLTINLGQGKEISIRALADEIARVTGSNHAEVHHEEQRPADVLRLYADSALAHRILGFKPRVGLSEGLAQLHEWYQASEYSPRELLEAEVVRGWAAPAVDE